MKAWKKIDRGDTKQPVVSRYDIERYLADEPVQACPPTARYRFRKFARRNKVPLVTAAIVAVSLLLGTSRQHLAGDPCSAHGSTGRNTTEKRNRCSPTGIRDQRDAPTNASVGRSLRSAKAPITRFAKCSMHFRPDSTISSTTSRQPKPSDPRNHRTNVSAIGIDRQGRAASQGGSRSPPGGLRIGPRVGRPQLNRLCVVSSRAWRFSRCGKVRPRSPRRSAEARRPRPRLDARESPFAASYGRRPAPLRRS